MSLIYLEVELRCDHTGCTEMIFGHGPDEVYTEADARGWQTREHFGDHCPRHCG